MTTKCSKDIEKDVCELKGEQILVLCVIPITQLCSHG